MAERKNRTVIEMVRSMPKEMNLPTFLWAEVAVRAVFILNRSPTSAVKERTPFEVIKGVKPSIEHLRVFGCVGNVCVDSQFRKKLDPKTQKCVLFGYCEDMKAYKMFDPMTGKIVISRNVRFFEEVHWDWSVTQSSTSNFVTVNIQNERSKTIQPQSLQQSSIPDIDCELSNDESSNGLPIRYRNISDIYNACSFALSIVDPSTFEEAAQVSEWQATMCEEMQSIQKNQT